MRRLRQPLRHRPLVHRRSAEARTRGARLHQPDRELLQAPGQGLRGTGLPGLLPGNRSAAVRIPITGSNPKAKRLEFRAPDASGNPYLAFAAQLMAGLDGIKNRIEPHEPVDKDLYELPPRSSRTSRSSRQPRRGPGRPGERLRVPARGRRLHRGAGEGLDRIQARGGDRSPGSAPEPLRVRALLLRVSLAPPARRPSHLFGAGAVPVSSEADRPKAGSAERAQGVVRQSPVRRFVIGGVMDPRQCVPVEAGEL